MLAVIRRRVVQPLIDLLTQGISPEKIALSLAFGIVLGVFPVLGSTTLLCALAAIVLKLNLPATQLVSWVMYPLQLLLLVPLMRIGDRLFRSTPLNLSLAQMLAMARENLWFAIQRLWVGAVHAIAAWMLLAPLAIWLLYRGLYIPIRHISLLIAARQTAAE
jgi:uncharacterized protein (DUF2062 family)